MVLGSKKGAEDLRAAHRHIQRRSRWVRVLRLVMPLSAFFFVTGLVAWPYFENMLHGAPSSEAPYSKTPPVRNTVDNPQLSAFDEKGRPYRLTAQKAQQKEEDKADLTLPRGCLLMPDGTSLQVASDQGQYDKRGKTLLCQKEVVFKMSNGYHLETPAARISFEDQEASGEAPLAGSGPVGSFASEEGFRMTEETLSLKGPSQLVIAEG